MDRVLDVLSRSPVLLLVGAGYLLGSIPFGLVLAKVFAHKDVRLAGSGNIGATNVARVAGKKLGVITLILDAAKGFFPVLLASRIALPVAAQDRLVVEGLVALAAVLGHCFSLFLLLRGGKGVATGLGVLLAHRPEIAGVGLVVFLLVYAPTRLVSAGSLVAAVAVVIALAVLGPRDVSAVPIALCFAVIVAKHHGNIRRLLGRSELKV